jgi:hypothetical protein
MAEYRLRLDPEGKEVLEAMLGPLSAPRPTPTCSDLRNSDQRRGGRTGADLSAGGRGRR